MSFIKVKDMDDKIIYVNKDNINKIILGNEDVGEKYTLVFSTDYIYVKESREIDKFVENSEFFENIFE